MKIKKHTVDLVIDRLSSKQIEKDEEGFQKRLTDAIELATNQSDGEVKILIDKEEIFFSENNTCLKCGISYPKIVPASFSFNAPEGACTECSGLGMLKEIKIDALYNPKPNNKRRWNFPLGQ